MSGLRAGSASGFCAGANTPTPANTSAKASSPTSCSSEGATSPPIRMDTSRTRQAGSSQMRVQCGKVLGLGCAARGVSPVSTPSRAERGSCWRARRGRGVSTVAPPPLCRCYSDGHRINRAPGPTSRKGSEHGRTALHSPNRGRERREDRAFWLPRPRTPTRRGLGASAQAVDGDPSASSVLPISTRLLLRRSAR